MMTFMYAYIVSIQIFSKNIHHIHLSMTVIPKLEKSQCCGTIIDNISYLPICVPEEKYRTSKTKLKNVSRFILKGTVLLIMHSKLQQIIFHKI